MKPVFAAALFLPVAILAGCGSKDGDGNAPSARVGPVQAIAPPAGKNWADMVVATADGGYRMGNPDAPIQLVEYGSFTCSHCADFMEHSHEPMTRDYISTGKVAFEFRSYLRDPLDLSASLLIQCGGPSAYFPLAVQVFAAQRDWMGRMQKLTPADLEKINALSPGEQLVSLAKLSGLDEFVAQRGVPTPKINACLTDQKVIQQLEASRNRANTEFNLQATPTFVLNGRVLDNLGTWEQVEKELKGLGA